MQFSQATHLPLYVVWWTIAWTGNYTSLRIIKGWMSASGKFLGKGYMLSFGYVFFFSFSFFLFKNIFLGGGKAV